MTKKASLFATSMILMTAVLTGLAVVPSASAHICTDTSTTTNCGDCNGSLTSPVHQHSNRYGVYCTSVGPAVLDLGTLSTMSVANVVSSSSQAFNNLF